MLNATVTKVLPLLLAASVLGACKGIEREAPPDVSDLVNAYQGPTAALDEEVAEKAVAALDALLRVGGYVCGWESIEDFSCVDESRGCRGCAALQLLFEGLDVVRERFQQEAANLNDPISTIERFAGEGNFRVLRRCAEVLDESGNTGRGYATIELTFGVGIGFDPVLWGRFDNCKIPGTDLVAFDGGYRLLISGEPFSLDELAQVPSIFSFDGSLGIDGGSGVASIDVRLSSGADGELVLRVPLADGSQLLMAQADGAIEVRATNGLWRCAFDERRCVSVDDEGEVVDW